MIEKNGIYRLMKSVKGWPVKSAHNLEEATANIFGSPYWDIPEDFYLAIDINDVYCLLGVFGDEKLEAEYHYLTVTARLDGVVELVDAGGGE